MSDGDKHLGRGGVQDTGAIPSLIQARVWKNFSTSLLIVALPAAFLGAIRIVFQFPTAAVAKLSAAFFPVAFGGVEIGQEILQQVEVSHGATPC